MESLASKYRIVCRTVVSMTVDRTSFGAIRPLVATRATGSGVSVSGTRRRVTHQNITYRPKSTAAIAHVEDEGFRSSEYGDLPGLKYEAHVDQEGSGILVRFPVSQGKTHSYFHAPWLWSNDPSQIHPTSGQRLYSPGQYPGTKIASVDVLAEGEDDICFPGGVKPIPPPPRGCLHPIGTVFKHVKDSNSHSDVMLRVIWEPRDSETRSTVSYYSMEWLSQCRYDEQAIQQRRQLSEVTSDHAIRRIRNGNDGLVHVDYNALTSDSTQDTRFELLHAIFRDGAAIIKNAPLESSGSSLPVAVACRALGGYLSHGSLYGDTFHVRCFPDANNIAYTSSPLQPHQDLAYYESPPGLQLLHCMEKSGVHGGESVLVDAMAAANYFREIAPHYFETLVRCSATFMKQRDDADIVYRRPHIVVGEGSAPGLVDGEILSVAWSPPFEGPLCIPPNLVDAYYEAYAAFEQLVDNSSPRHQDDELIPVLLRDMLREYAAEYTWERQLEPGEILAFNNRRLLHGRRGFTIHTGNGRHLVGAYTNIDDTLNHYRCLLRDRRDKEQCPTVNVGNGSVGVV